MKEYRVSSPYFVTLANNSAVFEPGEFRLHLCDPFFRDEVLQSEEGEGRKEGRERSSGRGRRDKSRAELPEDSNKVSAPTEPPFLEIFGLYHILAILIKIFCKGKKEIQALKHKLVKGNN